MPSAQRVGVLTELLDHFTDKLPAHRALVAIDGFDGAGKTHLAHELSALAARQHRRPIMNVTIDGFMQPQAARYRHGRGPDTFYQDSYDYPGFLHAVVEPLRAGQPITAQIWDVARDQPVPNTLLDVPPDAIVLVDGIFLHRPELVAIWDASVWVRVPFDVSVPRANARFPGDHDPDPQAPSNARYVGGQRLYLAESDPESHCTWIFDNTDLRQPSIHPRAAAG